MRGDDLLDELVKLGHAPQAVQTVYGAAHIVFDLEWIVPRVERQPGELLVDAFETPRLVLVDFLRSLEVLRHGCTADGRRRRVPGCLGSCDQFVEFTFRQLISHGLLHYRLKE